MAQSAATNPAGPATPTPGKFDAKLLNRSALRNLPPPEPLIKNVLDRGTVALLYGHWGTCKTFIAVDWACSVATGHKWQGLETERLKVLYVAGEGAQGYQARLDSWESGWQTKIPDADLTILPVGVNLTDNKAGGDVASLIALIKRDGYGFVVFDTLARCMVGADENSSKDCGVVIANLGDLREATPNGRGLILGVHHTGKDGSTYRGSSAFEGAADTVYFTKRDGGVITLRREKRRDGPTDDERMFRLDLIGDSGVLSVWNGTTSQSRLTRQQELLAIFLTHFSQSGAARSEIIRIAIAEGMSENTARRAINDLQKCGKLLNMGTGRNSWFVKV